MDKTWQKFREAMVVLARSGTVKDRLHTAFRNHLTEVEPSQLPLELREDFATLRLALKRERPLRGEDALAASIRKLSACEADALATQLVEIFARMSNLAPAFESTERGAKTVVPLFASDGRA